MLKNYFKIAWRNMTRNKVNSFINIAGLATGITCVIFILLYVADELNYDRFLKHADRIYQVNVNANFDGNEFLTGNTPPPTGPALVKEFPEIEASVRIYRPGDAVVRYEGDKQQGNYFTEHAVWGVDSNFLQVFSYKLIAGDPPTCLSHPDAVVITERTAKKYFNTSAAIGKILLFNDKKQPFTVTGILQDLPSRSSFQFDMLTPIAVYPVVKKFSWSWVWLQVNTYIKLGDNVPDDAASLKKLEAKFPAMFRVQAAGGFERIGKSMDEFLRKGGKWDILLQPFTKVHLHSAETPARLTTISDIKYVYIFSCIALFIMILACVNFINLSTAQSSKRAKEVGVRKVMGSAKNQLVRQFLSEALLYSFLATVLALTSVLVLLPLFNNIAGKTFTYAAIFSNPMWIIVLAMPVITGLLAGIYPAFYISSFQPAAVLKGMKLFKSGWGSLFFRNGLVVFQFTVSTALIICTLIVFKQLQFTRNRNMGLDKENVVVISNTNRLANNEESFRQELTKLPGIISASITTSVPAKDVFEDFYIPRKDGVTEPLVKEISLSSFMVDYDFIPTLQIKLTGGRNFSKDFNDSLSVIVNETTVKQIGWKEPLGKYLEYPGNENQHFRVIGVVKDFNIESIRNSVAPFALFHSSSNTYQLGKSYVVARIKPGHIDNTPQEIEAKWKSFIAATPFDYNFLDSEFDALYRSEQRMGSIFRIFTVLSIFVACLGLFGLAAYTAQRRTKEIGIRKTLGASVQDLVFLLSKDFIKLVLIASVIAFPLAWWWTNKWLDDFAYRINISWLIFLSAGLAAVAIALTTVSFQAIKAAIANPVKSLRTE
jgi:putative ABC transport system permease protein